MRIGVTQFGALTALGDTEAGFAALCAGKDGFGPAPAWVPVPVALVTQKLVPGFRTSALVDTILPAIDPVGLAVIFATTTSAMPECEKEIESVVLGRTNMHPEDFLWTHLAHRPAEALAARLGATGPAMSVSTACTSGTTAIGIALDLLRAGRCRRALVVGADSLARTTIFGFGSLGATTSTRPRPFDKGRDGMAIGEAGAFLLLEPSDAGVEVLGVATACDAQHLTAPDPEGAGLIRAVHGALAGVDPATVDHVNAHATATETNDGAEAVGIVRACPNAAVSATKGATGHTLGAAGVVEAVFLLQSMRDGVIPPVVGLQDPLDIDVSAVLRNRVQRVGVSVNLAFGGHSAAVAFRA